MSTTEEQIKSDVIDVNALAGNTETVNVSANANPFARQKPIPDSVYRGLVQPPSNAEDKKNMLHQRQIQSGQNKGQLFYVVDFEAVVQEYFDPQKNSKELLGKQRTFSKSASTITRTIDGEETNEIAYILQRMGFKIEGQVSVAELVTHFVQVLERKLPIGLKTEVGGRYDSGTKEKNAAGKEYAVWKTAYRGEKQFPKNPDGSTNYEVPPVNGHQVFVSADVIDYFQLPQ